MPTTKKPPTALIVAILVIAIVGAIGAYYWSKRSVLAPEIASMGEGSATERPAGTADEPSAEAPDLPQLDVSDSAVRVMARSLTQHPQIARWMATDDLVRRAVTAVDNIARGDSPRRQFDMMKPDQPFAARGDGASDLATGSETLIIDPSSYRRYDLVADVFASLDIGATARLLDELDPLVSEAYAEIGEPDSTFRQALSEAIDRLLEVEIPDQPPRVQSALGTYVYLDLEQEGLSPAAKHLLRMGPENARKVQTKLRFMRSALDL